MAYGRIKSITIEIDGNTTKLTTALKQVDRQIRNTEQQLKSLAKEYQNFGSVADQELQTAGKRCRMSETRSPEPERRCYFSLA